MKVYDRVIPNNATESLIALTTIIVVVVLFDFVMKIIRGNFVDRASLRIDREVSTELFDKISRHDTTLGRQATGALASTVRDFDLLKDVIGSATFTIFADLPFILLFLVVLYAIGGPVAAVPAVIVPLVILFGLLLQPIIKRMSELSLMQGKSKQAEIDDVSSVTFPAELQRQAGEAVAKEANLFLQRTIAFREQINVIRQSIEELTGNIAEKEAEVSISQTQYRIQKQEYDLLKPLVDAGHEPKLRLIEAETKFRQAEGAAELARLSVSSMQARREGLEKEIVSLKSQRRAEASTYLVDAQTGLEQAMARQESLEGRVAYADIRAPETGVISALHVKTIGAVVQAGTVLTEIVPLDAEHVVRARLLPQDVADVSLGQIARISLSAYDVSRYGALEGEVIHVASNTTEEQNAPPYYETLIAIGDKGFPNSNIVPEIVPGIQVTVDIIGGKRTVLNYILSPIQKAASVAFREK